MKKVHPFKTSLLCGFSLFAVASLSATTIAYDGFESYAEGGALNENNGGTGWNGSWSSISSAQVVSGGLDYSNGEIQISGGSNALRVQGTSDNVFLREFDTTGLGGEIYFSFLFNPVTSEENDFFNVFLTNGTSSNQDTTKESPGQIGDLSTKVKEFGARMNRNSGVQEMSGISYSDGETYLLVGRISNQGTSGTGEGGADFNLVELWVNPDSAIPGLADASVDFSNDKFTPAVGSIVRIGMRTSGVDANSDLRFDEFRIGTDFASVVSVIPEPSTYALLFGSVALLGMAFRGRRKR